MNLFFNPNINELEKDITFDKDESRHITKVLRKSEGDVIHLTDGKGSFFETVIKSDNPKKCIVTICSLEKQPPLPYSLHLAVAPTKLNDRYEWFLEKATEIGVTEITPIICDQSERRFIKHDRFEKIIQSAMKQSLKAYLPILNPAISFEKFITSNRTEDLKFIAHCENSEKQLLKEVIKPKKSILIMIGPEGDFSTKEISLSSQYGFSPISLGTSRLRTETAAIVACHSVSFALDN